MTKLGGTILILFFVYTVNCIGQIRGQVVEELSLLPVANVEIICASDTTVTNEEGRFILNTKVGDLLRFNYQGVVTDSIFIESESMFFLLQENNNILKEVIISAFGNSNTLRTTSAPIGIVDMAFSQTDPFTVVSSFNTIPGVQMEERSPGSLRLNIRGSSLRAPFDVRNVKIYWNDIPFTEPGGNTPFNLLDPINFGTTEIIRGPSGSRYGAGNGGTLIIRSKQPDINSTFAFAEYSRGSFGFNKTILGFGQSTETSSSYFQYAQQSAAGYRTHSSLDKKNIEYSGNHKLTEKQRIGIHLLYSDLFYEIPGGLTLTQFESDPTQARPGNAFTLGTEEANASVDTKFGMIGLTHRFVNGNYQQKTSVYGQLSQFINPFIFDFKNENHVGFGGRTSISQQINELVHPTRLDFGLEIQDRFAKAFNYGNVAGKADTLNFKDEIHSYQWMGFFQAETQWNSRISSTYGFSINQLNYDIFRVEDAITNNSSLFNSTIPLSFAPRISLLIKRKANVVYASISSGFSPPTLEEVRTNEGSINAELAAEKGLAFEIGTRGRSKHQKLTYDGNVFFYVLSNAIVDYPSARGTDLFRNAGGSFHSGLELLTTYRIVGDSHSKSEMDLQVAYTFNHFKFNDYITGNTDYSGQFIPGVAPQTVSALINSRFKSFKFSFNYLAKSSIYLNNENDKKASAFHLIGIKGSTNFTLSSKWQSELFFGANNLLNQHYSLGNDVNAFGGRYYQPAPERNYYAGLRFRWKRLNSDLTF